MRMGDAYIIVYSVTDKSSFEKASELRIQLRRARQSENIPIILVGNKSDLVRSREVSVDGESVCFINSSQFSFIEMEYSSGEVRDPIGQSWSILTSVHALEFWTETRHTAADCSVSCSSPHRTDPLT